MIESYYLWGAGSVGKRALEYLLPLGILKGIIDNDHSKQGQVLSGLTISRYDSIKTHLKETGVIIAHFSPRETEQILRRDQITHWRLAEFITTWFWAKKQQHAIGFLDLPITTFCTLSCIDCMQYVTSRPKHDVPFKSLTRELDALFRCVSFVGEMSIIGGEPFLYKQLPDILDYLVDNYRDRIGSLVITTNGTVTPETRTLERCSKANVFISVSDYSEAITHLGERIAKLELMAKEAGIRIERKRWGWFAPGIFNTDSDPAECRLSHMQLAEGKLWRCTLMAAGYFAKHCTAISTHDYYDLSYEEGARIHDFLSGSNQTERTSQCRKCKFPSEVHIPCARQV